MRACSPCVHARDTCMRANGKGGQDKDGGRIKLWGFNQNQTEVGFRIRAKEKMMVWQFVHGMLVYGNEGDHVHARTHTVTNAQMHSSARTGSERRDPQEASMRASFIIASKPCQHSHTCLSSANSRARQTRAQAHAQAQVLCRAQQTKAQAPAQVQVQAQSLQRG